MGLIGFVWGEWLIIHTKKQGKSWQKTRKTQHDDRGNFNIIKNYFKNVKVFLALIKLKCILIILKC